MAKQTSSKSSGGAAPGAAKKKRTSEAPAPITERILKADPVVVIQDGIRSSEPKPAPTHEQIALRAFELYQQRSAGALNDWLSAERELRQASLS
jgi:hypothetical protein